MKACLASVAALLCAVFAAVAAAPAPAGAEVSVSVNIGVPRIVIPAPPEMVPVPRSTVYFAPGVDADIFFSGGFWWTPMDGRWFRARSYNGPWNRIETRRVPVDVIRVPRDYRNVYVREERVPYGQLKKHWERRDGDRRRHRGEWARERHERRERERDAHREIREERRDHGDRGEYRDERREHGGRGRD